jgi:hypothetical protein
MSVPLRAKAEQQLQEREGERELGRERLGERYCEMMSGSGDDDQDKDND